MKNLLVLIIITLITLSLTACGQDKPASNAGQAPQAAAPTAPTPTPMPATPEANSTAGVTGTVTETMNAAGYTYVQVDSGAEQIWAAAPAFNVAVGDSVVVPEGMPMNNYHSKTLDKTFPVVYFVDSVLNASNPAAAGAATAEENHTPKTTAEKPEDIDLTNVAKADGGMTVGEIFGDKENLSGKEIALRGKVVKYSSGIMGKNWLHIQDGSGDSTAGTHDLTVTTDATANVGDTVVVTGALTLDKDFGYGYQYNVIMEDAVVTVE